MQESNENLNLPTASINDDGIEDEQQPTDMLEKVEEKIEEILDDEPVRPETKRKIAELVIQETKLHAGPLPSPEVLDAYEKVLPGTAERILQMAEKEQDHRHSKENKQLGLMEKDLKGDRTKISRGQWMGFGIAVIVFCISAFLIYNNFKTEGTILGTVDIVSLVAIFVLGKYNQQVNNEDERGRKKEDE